MAKETDILAALSEETNPLKASDIAKKLNTKPSMIATALKRLSDKQLIIEDAEGNYLLTEEGVKELNPATEESERMTESAVLTDYGVKIGVPLTQAQLIQDHVWRGGRYEDLQWVWQALTENNVKSDSVKRWVSL